MTEEARTIHRPRDTASQASDLITYWALDVGELQQRLRSSPGGLSSVEAEQRLQEYGRNELRGHRTLSRLQVLWGQLRSPLLLLLIFAAGASALTGQWVDAGIVIAIVFASAGIGYSREYNAQTAAAALRARVRVRASVLRDGQVAAIPLEEVVPGDVVLLSAGTLIAADAVIVEAADCFVSEAVLTGESFPAEKKPGAVTPDAALA